MKYFLLALAAGAVGYYVGTRRAASPPAADVELGDAPSGSLWDRIGSAFSHTLGAVGGAGGAPAASPDCVGCGGKT